MKNKLIIVSLILIIITSVFQSMVFASEPPATTGTQDTAGTTGGAGFQWSSTMTTMTTQPGNTDITDPVNKIAGTAITVAQVIAMGVAIIMLIVLAMKYMISAPEDKASIKKHAVPYVVGAVIMFACTGILEIIRKFATVLD